MNSAFIAVMHKVFCTNAPHWSSQGYEIHQSVTRVVFTKRIITSWFLASH